MGFTKEKFGIGKFKGNLPDANRRVELCYDREKKIVWLQINYIKGAFFETGYIGAIPTASGGWTAIDLATVLRSRDNVLSFGTKLGEDIEKIEKFQTAILCEWDAFNGARPARWAKGLTFGHDLSSPSFVIKAIKTGFDAIGVRVAAYDGLRTNGYTVEDTILYLQKRAAAAGIATRDSGLLDFKEIIPDSSLRVQEDRAKTGDKRDIPCIISKRRHGGRFAYAESTESIPFPRVNSYGFRGDNRAPSGIKNAGGFNPNYTRPAHIAEAKDKGIDAAIAEGLAREEVMKNARSLDLPGFKNALDLPAYILAQQLGGYISVTRSYAVAKFFAAGMGGTTDQRGPGWVYACFVEGAFVLPPKGSIIPAEGTRPEIKVPYNEQELAMPGVLDWEDVIGCRRVDANGVFTGNIFMRASMFQEDADSAIQIWKLLSGESQGAWQ